MESNGETVEQVPEDLDARKPAARVGRAGRGRSRRSMVAVVELIGGVANATAEAFRALNAALTPELVAAGGLRAGMYAGLRDGNVRFFEELSRTSGRVFDALRGPTTAQGTPEAADMWMRQIDYERLAELVSIEMRKEPSHTP